jgi:hypothetical protein
MAVGLLHTLLDPDTKEADKQTSEATQMAIGVLATMMCCGGAASLLYCVLGTHASYWPTMTPSIPIVSYAATGVMCLIMLCALGHLFWEFQAVWARLLRLVNFVLTGLVGMRMCDRAWLLDALTAKQEEDDIHICTCNNDSIPKLFCSQFRGLANFSHRLY